MRCNTEVGEKLVEILGGEGGVGNGERKNGNRRERVRGIKTTKDSIESDLILLGTGVRPNSEIARDAGIDLGYANAIKVDEYMRTSISNIFAAGDCATATSDVTGRDTYLPLGTTANKQGEIGR